MNNILIVDDDIECLDSLKEFIESEGFKVTTCSNGNEALHLQHKCPFDIIITDIIMPQVDGLEVIYQINKNYPTTKIIGMTGGGIFHAMDLLVMAKELGASMVLTKPINLSLLKIQISSLC